MIAVLIIMVPPLVCGRRWMHLIDLTLRLLIDGILGIFKGIWHFVWIPLDLDNYSFFSIHLNRWSLWMIVGPFQVMQAGLVGIVWYFFGLNLCVFWDLTGCVNGWKGNRWRLVGCVVIYFGLFLSEWGSWAMFVTIEDHVDLNGLGIWWTVIIDKKLRVKKLKNLSIFWYRLGALRCQR